MSSLKEQLSKYPAFREEAEFLSNFSKYEPEEYMHVDGLTFKSSEHYYQAMKFHPDKQAMEKIANHPFTGLKKFVRQLGPIRADWDLVKNDVMRTALEHKFSLPRYKALLLSTGDLELVERNTWGDTYWGVVKGKGHNHLGKILMEIRTKLQTT